MLITLNFLPCVSFFFNLGFALFINSSRTVNFRKILHRVIVSFHLVLFANFLRYIIANKISFSYIIGFPKRIPRCVKAMFETQLHFSRIALRVQFVPQLFLHNALLYCCQSLSSFYWLFLYYDLLIQRPHLASHMGCLYITVTFIT